MHQRKPISFYYPDERAKAKLAQRTDNLKLLPPVVSEIQGYICDRMVE